MSGNITTPVPANLRVPLFWASFDNSMAGFLQPSYRVLLLGSPTSAGPAGPVFVSGFDDAAGAFGVTSMLAAMVRAYRANDPISELWCLPVSGDVADAAAAGGYTFAGTATAAGTLALYIGSDMVTVPVNTGDDGAAIATAAAAAINAALLPATASVTTLTTATVTAGYAGLAGDSMGLDLNRGGRRAGQSLPAGITVAIAAMAGGAGVPDLAGLADALGSTAYDIIVCPFSDAASLAVLTGLMNDATGRWAWSQQLYGHVVTAQAGAVADLLAFAGAGVLNDPHLTLLGLIGSTTPDCIAAAAFAGAIAQSLFNDPALPLQTLPIKGLVAPAAGVSAKLTDQQTLLTNGVALPVWLPDGSAQVLRAVTTYQLNRWNVPDQSYLDTETLFTLAAITRRLRAAVLTKFARCKIADDGTRAGPGQNLVTPRSFKAEIANQYALMEADGLVENAAAMIAATIVERSSSDPSRLEVLWAPYLVSGLRIVDLVNQFRLNAA